MAKRCYIAGPMSGLAEFNFPAFDSARDVLSSEGWDVVSPADLDRRDGFNASGCTGFEPIDQANRQRFARNDISALLTVDAVFLLPDWQRSTGAMHEVEVATWLGVELIDYATRLPQHYHAEFAAPKMNARAEVLRTAESLVNGDRNAQYGDPRQDFQRTAEMWSAYLGNEVHPHDVAALMCLLKVSRIRWSPQKLDSWIDLAGYAACGWDCARED